MIVIDIASLTVLFCNCPLLKNISINTEFVGFVWLTSNHMFGFDNFRDKSTSWFLKILTLPSFYWGNFKNCTRATYPKLSFQTCDY